MTDQKDEWLIWAPEHQGFWKAGRHGYTHDKGRAHRFTTEQALLICNTPFCDDHMVPSPKMVEALIKETI